MDKSGRATTPNNATIAVIIPKHEEEKQKEQDEKESFKQGIIDDLKGVINSWIASVMGNRMGPKRTLQRASNNTNITSDDDNASKCQNDASRTLCG